MKIYLSPQTAEYIRETARDDIRTYTGKVDWESTVAAAWVVLDELEPNDRGCFEVSPPVLEHVLNTLDSWYLGTMGKA